MDLRDEFAMAALCGLMANVRVNIRLIEGEEETYPDSSRGPLAQACFDMAEAMMEERRKRHGLDRLRATIGPSRFVRCESQVVRVRGSPRCVDLQPGHESHHRTFKKKTLKNLTVVAIWRLSDLRPQLLDPDGIRHIVADGIEELQTILQR